MATSESGAFYRGAALSRSLFPGVCILGFAECQTFWNGEIEAIYWITGAGFMAASAALTLLSAFDAARGENWRADGVISRGERVANALAIGMMSAA